MNEIWVGREVPRGDLLGRHSIRALAFSLMLLSSCASAPLVAGATVGHGRCDKGDINRKVRAKATDLQRCYQTELAWNRDAEGLITVTWTIGPDGLVTGATAVEDKMHSRAVRDCVLETIGRIEFFKPEGGSCVIQWPFVFSRQAPTFQ